MIAARLWRPAVALGVALFAGVTTVWAFAEEPLTFRDPGAGVNTDDEISTIHNDLTYVLALAAGFSISDSITLQIWNQLVDSEQLGPGDAISYTNCSGAFYAPPDPGNVCGAGIHSHLIWPRWDDMKDADTCATSRFGPYSPFFHFPHQTGPAGSRDLGALREWAWGRTETLTGYEAYAWGKPTDLTVMQATCLYTRTAVIATGIEAGSLQAFGTYLHSLADAHSHEDCIAVFDDLDMPWATHTLNGYPECDYNPTHPQDDDVHGREFGDYADTQRTDAAVLDIYDELVARSLQREGQFQPINLDVPISGTQTLRDLLYDFVHKWGYGSPGPENRRTLADQMADAVLARRSPRQLTYLPLARN